MQKECCVVFSTTIKSVEIRWALTLVHFSDETFIILYYYTLCGSWDNKILLHILQISPNDLVQFRICYEIMNPCRHSIGLLGRMTPRHNPYACTGQHSKMRTHTSTLSGIRIHGPSVRA
jgi:hypothetical protein